MRGTGGARTMRWTLTSAGMSRARHRLWRWVALLAALAGLGMGLAACGGGSPRANSNSPGSPASNSSASVQVELLKFSECVRSHGDPDFPDMTVGQPPSDPSNFNTPQFQAAKEACQKYLPGESPTPAQKATAQAETVKFAECMRSHGEPDFPDPTSNGQFNVPQSLESNSPQFQAAEKVCQSLDPGFQNEGGGGSGSPGSGS